MLFQNFYEFRDAQLTCPDCGWSGTGRETGVGEIFSELFEFNCPRCDEKLGICNHPSIEDAREKWNRLSEAERRDWEAHEDRRERRQRESLHSHDELPDPDADVIVVSWDLEELDEQTRWYVLRCGERELWREPAGFKDYRRFEEVVALLMAKYGTRLKDVVPSGAATFFLWGDRLSAGRVIAEARERVQAAAEGRPTEMELRQRAEEARIAAAEKEKAFHARRRRGKLRSAEQLPDLDAEEIVITWDWEEGPREEWGGPLLPAWYYVLSCGEELVWRQPAGWEDYELFGEIASILVDRYGLRLKDLIPSPAARGSLGVTASAPGPPWMTSASGFRMPEDSSTSTWTAPSSTSPQASPASPPPKRESTRAASTRCPASSPACPPHPAPWRLFVSWRCTTTCASSRSRVGKISRPAKTRNAGSSGASPQCRGSAHFCLAPQMIVATTWSTEGSRRTPLGSPVKSFSSAARSSPTGSQSQPIFWLGDATGCSWRVICASDLELGPEGSTRLERQPKVGGGPRSRGRRAVT